ncbi:MAG: hypothetical protein H6738_03175 [Alphaproteobacteria bacterium]|nr:hypothetical protein [Alphaproteobacteria bacterium]
MLGEPSPELTVASLFAPVPNGLYFFVGRRLPHTLSRSVALVGPDYETDGAGDNCLIVLDGDPQLTFYRLLDALFGRRSTGVIAATAVIHPEAELGRNVQVDDFCVIGRCVIGDDVVIGSHCRVHDGVTVRARSVVDSHSVLGACGVAWIWDEDQTTRVVQPQLGGVTVGEGCFIGAQTVLVRGSLNEATTIGDRTMMAPGCRIGHGTRIGASAHLANNIVTGGNSVIGDFSFVGSAAVLRPKVKLHDHTIVGAGAVIVKDTSGPGLTLTGVPAIERPTKEAPSGMPRPPHSRNNQ